MPTDAARLHQKDRLLRLLLGTIVIGAIGFCFLLVTNIISSHDQTVDANNAAYANAVRQVKYQRAGCTRGILDRVENIESDERQKTFFPDAAKARAQGKTKLDQETAKKYRRNSRESAAAAQRRATRLLGANLKTLKLKTRNAKGKSVPAQASMDEAVRVCVIENAMPKRPEDPPYVKVFGLEI